MNWEQQYQDMKQKKDEFIGVLEASNIALVYSTAAIKS
jgi:hypothetical protein